MLSEVISESHYAAIAQSVERILGKDEVTSSNLVSSSMKPCNRNGCRVFAFLQFFKLVVLPIQLPIPIQVGI